MSAALLGLLAESHVHPGTGQSDGTVDLPVARERTTSYPFVPGSSCKGALKEAAERVLDEPAIKRLFGVQDTAGRVMVSDARLLLLPVRSLTGAYRWLTCPYLVERLIRDRLRVGLPTAGVDVRFTALEEADPPVIASGTGRLFLEERSFGIVAAPTKDLVDLLGTAIGDTRARGRLPAQLAVVSDRDFAWFARYALSIQARNCLQPRNPREGEPNPKTSTNLWYEETLPPDTVLYLTLNDRYAADGGGDSATVAGLFAKNAYLQLGGNETVGQGWFRVAAETVEG